MNPAAPVTRIVLPLRSIFFVFIVYLISKVNWGESLQAILHFFYSSSSSKLLKPKRAACDENF